MHSAIRKQTLTESSFLKSAQTNIISPTVLAFALALELPLDQMQEMLVKAGFSLSHSNKFDIIIEFFVKRGNYNVYEINEALFAFDQSLIGA